MNEPDAYAILREQWEDHIPNCPNCRRAQPDYWAEIFTQLNREQEQDKERLSNFLRQYGI